jgi:hypothetical protein
MHTYMHTYGIQWHTSHASNDSSLYIHTHIHTCIQWRNSCAPDDLSLMESALGMLKTHKLASASSGSKFLKGVAEAVKRMGMNVYMSCVMYVFIRTQFMCIHVYVCVYVYIGKPQHHRDQSL